MISTVFLLDFSGSRMHERKNDGCTPKVEMLLAFTFTASQPILSSAPVIGSIFVIKDLSPRSMTALSIPAAGPKVTSLRFAPRFSKTTCFRISAGIFPGGSVITNPS